MKHPKLATEPRTVFGKEVKKLRRVGIMPASIYGKNIPSVSFQVKTADFQALYKEVGETGLVDVEIEGKAKPSLIKNIHWDYRTRTPMHADFYQVNLKEKIKAMVPLTITDEAQAVTDQLGMMMTQLSEVEVEALPENLPDQLEVSVAHLAAVGDQVTVEALKTPSDVTILTEPTQIIVKIAELVAPETEEEVEEAAAEEGAEGETATEEGSETTEAAEGEKPAEEEAKE